MEPRSFDRGDGVTSEAGELATSVLQWSRGLLTAETRRPSLEPCGRASLQWSRGLLTAETRIVEASMTLDVSGFNGAAVF